MKPSQPQTGWYALMGIHDTDPNNPNKEFAPEGWHVPSDAEWTTLEEYLIVNGYNYDGSTRRNLIAKSMASTKGWNSRTETGAPGNDQSLNNSSGFNAFPEGGRNNSGLWLNEGESALIWSSTEYNSSNVWFFDLLSSEPDLSSNRISRRHGLSVRFVKN